ncbi:hypothetical protein TanjilG_00866 [Lupinus angustifolius]|uniref:Uncharacterized protein n=1 Tax=Lupinus angustifolius TaxID=3871 RepID=A0A4P1QQR5_LUPAN|nr:hypothetical protein TanjilG_00866 [Lupinus angustifolius]
MTHLMSVLEFVILFSIRSALRGRSGECGRPSGGSIFVGGFVLGGIIVGALGCVYAPQISRVLAGADSNDFMRKLTKIYV